MAFCAHLRHSPALAALQGLVPQQQWGILGDSRWWRDVFCPCFFSVFHGFLTASRPACWRVSSSSWLCQLAATSKICSVRTVHSSMDCIDWFGVMPSNILKYVPLCSAFTTLVYSMRLARRLVKRYSDPIWSRVIQPSLSCFCCALTPDNSTCDSIMACHATSCHVAPCVCNAPARTSAPLWAPWPPLTERDVRN